MSAHLRNLAALLMLVGVSLAPFAHAQQQPTPGMVQLDFNDVELSVVIDTIAQLTETNFIYDDKVRGRVTVISPTAMTRDQAYAVFESILQVKGFTTVRGPGGTVKIIPIREAKESSVETLQGRQSTPNRDRFVTRLIPLRYIDAEAIAATLKPLISKEASMVSYAPTNTIILTDSGANIRRLLGILDAIDVETYKENLAVLKVHHGDAATLATQLSDIYGAETGTSTSTARGRTTTTAARRAANRNQAAKAAGGERGKVRILTDERTNSLIVLASRARLEDIRQMVRRLDVPVIGGGRIHVHYLRHADAEELSNTLTSLVGGQPQTSGPPGRGSAQAQALRAAVTELADGVTVTADAATNALVIQASQEGYRTLVNVIDKLDIPRPQVLVEALIMEVNISTNSALGFNGVVRLGGPTDITLSSSTDRGSGGTSGLLGTAIDTAANAVIPGAGLATNAIRNSLKLDDQGNVKSGTYIQGIVRANATNGDTNILSAPHILTSDNEEAEIRIGNNIPIITNRVESAAGQDTNLATSVNVERQDIGVTLRVTPQITEGDSLRLELFQEISNIDPNLQLDVGAVGDVGVALTNREVENTVVVADGETIVIGGLISDRYTDSLSKVPWFGDIPVLGWLFKTESRTLEKINLLIFLTPHIVRNAADLEYATLRKREEFRQRSVEAIALSEKEAEEVEKKNQLAVDLGLPRPGQYGRNPARRVILEHEERYPLERMLQIEQEARDERERFQQQIQAAKTAPRYSVQAAVFGTEGAAATTLTQLVDAGYDGFIVTGNESGSLLFRVVLGPYEEVGEARIVADAVRAGFGLAPAVVVGEPMPGGSDAP